MESVSTTLFPSRKNGTPLAYAQFAADFRLCQSILTLALDSRNAGRMSTSTEALESAILSLVAARGPERTICPSEAARAVAGDHPDQWAPLMQPVRKVAVRLMKEGRLVITRKGRPVDPDDFRGVYRLSLPRLD
jgi:hypothetical protein